MTQLNWPEFLILQELTDQNYDNITGFPFLFFSDISEDYQQTSDYESEGLTIVGFNEFLRINNMKIH